MRAASARLALCFAILLATVVACAPFRDPHPQELELGLSKNAKTSDALDQLDSQTWEHLHQLFDFYAIEGRLSASQFDLLLNKFAPSFREFTASSLKNSRLVTFTFEELSQQLEDDCLTLTWLKQGNLQSSTDRLETLKKVYPRAQGVMIERLASAINARYQNQVLSARNVIELGSFLSRIGQQFDAAETSPAFKSLKSSVSALVKKTLWAVLPTLTIDQVSISDRQLAEFSVASSLSSDALATGQAQKTIAPDPLRESHRKLFTSASIKDQTMANRFERLDWQLTTELIPVLKSSSRERTNTQLKTVFERLFASWNFTAAFIDTTSDASMKQDLLIASATDQLMQLCDLVPPTTGFDKTFLQVFLFKISALTVDASEAKNCGQVREAFKP